VERQVVLIDSTDALAKVGVKLHPDVKWIAYDTLNKVTNAGREPWRKETGLLSIWLLGMFNPSPNTTIVVPIRKGPESELGPKVTSDYFGEVPKDRLVVKDDVVYFSGDGKFRSKIGISPKRSKGLLGSYDPDHGVLTILLFTQPENANDYVNSLWKLQDNPYGGDAANSYNDGPPSPGAKPLGPFYELESSSPALELKPGQSMSHAHRMFHLIGLESELDSVARQWFGVSLAEIKSALPK
jgi:hypothetical protein